MHSLEPEALIEALAKRDRESWLIIEKSSQILPLTQSFYQQFKQSSHPLKILLLESEPVRFLAAFIAAIAAYCPVFLGNPHWGEREYQQVLELIQPHLVLGQSFSHFPESNSDLKSDLPLIMIPTGGSSGSIKFAVHTWSSLVASVQGFQEYFQIDEINSFCLLPLYHVSGLMQFIRSFLTQGQFLIPASRTLTSPPTSNFFISLVPTQLRRYLQDSNSSAVLTQFQTILLGGAPAEKSLLQAAQNLKIPLALTYGMTETASQIVTLKPEDFLKGNFSNGKVLPHAKLFICDETGQVLESNQWGTLQIQSQSLMLGYYAPNFDCKPQLSSFISDDLGYFDDCGYLHIIGRQSYKIITGGENVFPSEVEAAILATQLVNDVGVIGLPDTDWGQAVTAVYIPQNPGISISQIQTALTHQISKYKQPKHWIQVNALPRNAQGKLNYEELKKMAVSWISCPIPPLNKTT